MGGLPLVEFPANRPVDLALKFADGKPCPGKYGKPTVMFTTVDGRVMFLEPEVADKVKALGAQPGQPLRFIKLEVPQAGGTKAVAWQVERLAIGEQGNGTFIVPKEQSAAPPPLPQSVTNPRGSFGSNGSNGSNGHGPMPDRIPLEHSGLSLIIREHANMLVDCMGSVVEYSKKYSGAIRNEDVRALVITVYIEQTKKGPRI